MVLSMFVQSFPVGILVLVGIPAADSMCATTSKQIVDAVYSSVMKMWTTTEPEHLSSKRVTPLHRAPH
eukprot:2813950-Amphidinium_carterae.1